MSRPSRLFLLSPASCHGERAALVVRPEAEFPLARRLRTPAGAALGDVFSFLSGLYFRGKLAYAATFARPPRGLPGVLVITPSRGLLPPAQPVGLALLGEFAAVDLHPREARYTEPLARDARLLAEAIGSRATEVVLLGSVATGKYVDVLTTVLGPRLRFPADFVGRGDMSRGALLLRAAREGRELDYVGLVGATRRGPRAPGAGRGRDPY